MRQKKQQHYTGDRLVLNQKFLVPARIENLARFNFFIQHAKGLRILDIGCGIGEGTGYIGQIDPSKIFFGIDLEFNVIKAARMQFGSNNVFFTAMDAQRLAFGNQAFDSIISVEVIEHLSDPEAYLQEASRLLQPGGLFMLTTPNRLRSSPTPGSLWPAHVLEYSLGELTDLLTHFFSKVEMWGEMIPIYENNIFRRVMHSLAPVFKPILPKYLRVRSLQSLQMVIKSDLEINDIVFTQDSIEDLPTLVALCTK